jgi:WD40 repeat protein
MRSGEVYEVSLNSRSQQLLTEGHAAMGLYGLDANPKNPDEIATVGEDGTLRIWSLSRNVCIRKVDLGCPCRSLAWSSDATRLVVGAGTETDSGMKDGAFLVVQSHPMGIISEDRFAKKTITDIKYNVDGTMIGFTSRDSKCYLVDASSRTLLHAFSIDEKGTFFTDFDFNVEGTIVRLATNKESLYNFTTADGTIIPAAAAVRSETWNTNHTIYSWMTKCKLTI